MLVNSISVRNYRGISNIELDAISPITVIVGRNNTCKSAFLEAFALGSTSKQGWVDTLGADLIERIINKRVPCS